ncbi:MAG: hypothetical protein ACRC2T_11745 [Thermoguttaceae bacterium]
MEALALLLFIGSAYMIGGSIYKSGKAIGSRKGYNVGRRRGRKR